MITMILLYLDPGTGSLIIQAIVAGIAGVGIFYQRIKNFFTKPENSIEEKDGER